MFFRFVGFAFSVIDFRYSRVVGIVFFDVL